MIDKDLNKFLCELFDFDSTCFTIDSIQITVESDHLAVGSIHLTVNDWDEDEEDAEETVDEQTPTFETSNPIRKKEDYPLPDAVLPAECDLYPTRAIFHNPATIVFWNDGTKTVALREVNDDFDSEKGLMVAILKKILGGGEMHRWMDYLKTFNAETTKDAEE